ncbi:TetR/AcrR family transcriptional regulator [Variovorax ginsengisoli]|uniref:TetR/AcrR family transcriptional regulator n=1 Tax=Variovorax ginsengisoli TaxID=363844 RepID=A0ABT8SI20_9BURK|nr:TetR/AcrR family transcriptional regulator [Variovorax ginsengisoli]MDN8618823.1 TetR/AcrR family transcriptional regulator [Variovorax ginsengisoli]MDO1537993.1 TetR/AcrR family transcriptional regulator [Variovorax ginsengisoli]
MPTKTSPKGTAAKPGARSSTRSSARSETAGVGAPPPRSPGRARSDASRVAILDATLKLLGTTPLQQISIESIAREAGVGKATIYRWWNSKAAVVIEAFLHTHLSHTPMPRVSSPREALIRHIHLLIDEYNGWSGRVVAQVLAEGQGDPDVLREFRERFWYGRRAVVREVLEDARRLGEIRSDMDAELQMDMLYAPIYFRLLVKHLPLDKKFADTHCIAVMQMLAPPEAGAVATPPQRRNSA